MKIAKFIGLSLGAGLLLNVVLYVTWAELAHDWRNLPLGWQVFPAGVFLVGMYYLVFRKKEDRQTYLKGFIGGLAGFAVAYVITWVWQIYGVPHHWSWAFTIDRAPGAVWLVAWPLGSVLGAYLAVR